MKSVNKRILDLFVSISVIVFFAPFFLLVWLLVFVNFGFPVFFVQERPGKHGVPFRMIKFRTMTQQTDVDGRLLSDEQRLTRFGRFLRSSSLDELPELINVIRGDMSLVGPRPLLMEYLPLYSERQYQRHDVKPGITGWAQIKGRNALSWEEKFELDVWYVDNQSVWLDIKILFKTVFQVLKRDGISHSGEATMPRFTGSDKDR